MFYVQYIAWYTNICSNICFLFRTFTGSISNIDGAEYRCNKTQVRKVISGVVGAASSVTSIQVANLLRLFRIPQVSIYFILHVFVCLRVSLCFPFNWCWWWFCARTFNFICCRSFIVFLFVWVCPCSFDSKCKYFVFIIITRAYCWKILIWQPKIM